MALTIVGSVIASSGFWGFMIKYRDGNDAKTKLLLGLAHDRIIHLGMGYLERGWVTKDEYEDFIKYLYAPYSEFGGNGLADKVVQEVKTLPIYSRPPRDWRPEGRMERSVLAIAEKRDNEQQARTSRGFAERDDE